MVANNEQAFDNGFGLSESELLNQQDSLIGVGLGVGGSAGVGVSYGGGGGGSSSTNSGYVPIVQTPNLANSDITYTIRVDANKKDGTSVYVNGENTYENLQAILYYSISQILNEGPKVITVQNSQGWTSDEKYVIDVVNNPKYQDIQINTNLNINPYDSLIQYQTRNLFSYDNYLNTSGNTNAVYSTVPAYTIRVKKYVNDFEQLYENKWNFELLDNERGIFFTLLKIEDEILFLGLMNPLVL